MNFKEIGSWWWAIVWALIGGLFLIANISNKWDSFNTNENIFVTARKDTVTSCMKAGTASLTFCECVADYLMKDLHGVEDIQALNTWSISQLNKLSDEAARYCREW